MYAFQFFELFYDNLLLYFFVAVPIIYSCIYYVNKICNSWFNPIAFNLLQACIGISVAAFLFFTKQATKETATYIFLSSLIFYFILWKYFPREPHSLHKQIINEELIAHLFFIIFFYGNIALTLYSYSVFGIPIFNEDSRLSTYTGSGGFGVILRLTGFLRTYSLFYIFFLFSSKRISKMGLALYLSPLIIFGILSGSRSSFMSIIFSWWGFNRFFLNKEISALKYKKLIMIFVIISISTFAIGLASDFKSGFFSFMDRIIACGDLYWYALPDDNWERLEIKTPFYDLLVNFFGPFRLMSEANADMPIGYQLTRIVYDGFDKMSGPVELFPVSSLSYFGYYGGLLFTVFQAIIACKVFRLFYKTSNSIIWSSFFYFAFIKSIDFLGAFKNAMGQLFDILLNYSIIWILLIIFSGVLTIPSLKNR